MTTLSMPGQMCEGETDKATSISIFPVNPVTAYKVCGHIGNHPVQLVVDTGAAVSLLSLEIGNVE